ncbi:hypothetical protein LTR56_019408 [Elasticomyces elasticus]|nr:hypothetical protein LTR22_023434 [Elasticomyces elasticus]KAK3627084.1 hypothetical protein LTR56_019408 [Elasticomyces elasticus]KAK4904708.1 hypothetical protein LTR49_025879 [Elasticomyces elasticus]KAK5746516.1 hypothetical protein LTS12_022699 [Elasticomyces elasticus]
MDGTSSISGQGYKSPSKLLADIPRIEAILMSAHEKVMQMSTPLEEKIVQAMTEAARDPNTATNMHLRFSGPERELATEAYEVTIDAFTKNAAFHRSMVNTAEKSAEGCTEIAKEYEELTKEYEALPGQAQEVAEMKDEAAAYYVSATDMDGTAAWAREESASMEHDVAIWRLTCMVLRFTR